MRLFDFPFGRRPLVLISHFSFFLFISSCTKDFYDKGEGEYSLLRADFVEAHVRGDKRVDYVLTDDGDSLRTNKPFTVSWLQKGDTIYRALLYYNLIDGEVDGYNLSQVLTPTIKRPDRIKGGMKTDPVHLVSLWKANTGRYLNMRLRIMTGETSDSSAVQAFGCVCDTVMSYDNGYRTMQLRLYHDQGGQPEYYSREVYLSIPVHDVKADTIIMRVRTYDNEVERLFINN